MNLHAIRAIYVFEMSRTFRTIFQSIATPVITTSLYFVVFGSAIGSRMVSIDGVSYGAFIVPGLIMLTVLTESLNNASFGIYMPKFAGTIYEMLSAPISYVEVLAGYVGSAATKSVMLGTIILVTARLFVPGRLQTAIPRALAASRLIVFTPTPIFWTRRRRGAASMWAEVSGSRTCQITSISGRSRPRSSSSSSGHTAMLSPSSASDPSRSRSPAPAA